MSKIIEIAAPLLSITLSVLAFVGAYLSYRAKLRASDRIRAARLTNAQEQTIVVDVVSPAEVDNTPLNLKESEDEQA